ncbi:MAG: hydrogenase expression protein [Dehalococcoidia bacterium]|nr:hydrogenase expression protein [Dehalococcoidia bacterium]
MRLGKLPPALLASLLASLPQDDPRVVVGPGVGADAAVIDVLGEAGDGRLLVAKSDPITFATDRIGWYTVHVNANDLACLGATPRWLLATALLPERWEEADVRGLFDDLGATCASLNITLVGGHTEITAGLDRPIVSACLLGEVIRERLVRPGGAQPGDTILLAGGVAIEGCAVLAREAGDALAARGVSAAIRQQASAFLTEPGISVVKAADLALDAAGQQVHALHDPTEGGLLTGLAELAAAAGAGLEAQEEALVEAVLPECQAVCESLELDPLGLLASGALLAAVTPTHADQVAGSWHAAGLPVFRLGLITSAAEGLQLRSRDRESRPLPVIDRDEIARYFEEVAEA